MDLQLELWREVGRHMELQESATHLLALLRPELPVAGLRLAQLLPAERCLEVAVETPSDVGHGAQAFPLAAADLAALQRWFAQAAVTHLQVERDWPPALAVLKAAHPVGDTLAAPIGVDHGAQGVVLLYAVAGKRFSQAHIELMSSLREVFGVALANHLRLRELARLRAAAEADRQSLLTRLGRAALEEDIVGSTQGLQPVLARVDLVAASNVSVLILGETGTGKEVIARAIHQRSARAAGPFIRVNCGAISPELIDSELFGHEKGSFTGAVAERRGWFERADGGTLFLDEIGELPASAQVRLLRVLQDGRFHRVGGESEIEVDVRIVAATHRDIALMVQHRQFREDLWYRIAVFPIILPPLRERRGDIPELALHFARRAARRLGLPFSTPTPADIALLQSYAWPGNVREMSAVLERAAILGQGERLAVGAALGVAAPLAAPVTSAGLVSAGDTPAAASLDEAVSSHIRAALTQTHGRVSGEHGAAALLKVNPNTLRARLRKLKIDPRQYRRR